MRERLEPIAVAFVDGTIKAVEDMAVEEIERSVRQCASMAQKFGRQVLWLNDVARALREHGARRLRDLPTEVIMSLEVRRPFDVGEGDEA
jgi:hypothetical protein